MLGPCTHRMGQGREEGGILRTHNRGPGSFPGCSSPSIKTGFTLRNPPGSRHFRRDSAKEDVSEVGRKRQTPVWTPTPTPPPLDFFDLKTLVCTPARDNRRQKGALGLEEKRCYIWEKGGFLFFRHPLRRPVTPHLTAQASPSHPTWRLKK